LRSYEQHRDLLTQVKSMAGTNVISQFDCQNDAVGRRTSVKNSGQAFPPVGPAFNLYGYNSRPEVTSANRYFGTDTGDTSDPVSGQSYGYAFDPTRLRALGALGTPARQVGNRRSTTNNSSSAAYTANNLNQYSERAVPGVADVIGSANTGAFAGEGTGR